MPRSDAERWQALFTFAARHHPNGDGLAFRHPAVLKAMPPRMRRWVDRLDVECRRFRWRELQRSVDRDRREARQRGSGQDASGSARDGLEPLERVVDRLADVVATLAKPEKPGVNGAQAPAPRPRPNGRYVPLGNTYDQPLGGLPRFDGDGGTN